MEWKAKWITGSSAVDVDAEVAPYLFQKTLNGKSEKEIVKATLTATALGIYNISLGYSEDSYEKVDDRFFAPGYTEYCDRLQYQTYDVTDLFRKKAEEAKEASLALSIRAEVTGGWYAGRLGLVVTGNIYGKKRALLAQLLIEYKDGSSQLICTDESWQVTTHQPRRFGEFFAGETYDARIIPDSFEPVTIYEGKVPPVLFEEVGVPVRVHDSYRPVKIWTGADGETLVDFGRNRAGIVEIGPFEGHEGQKIVIRHGEILDKGVLFQGNLRSALQTITYTCKEGLQTYRPEFTYMGFRYVSVTGLTVTEENLKVWDLYSDMEEVGSFSCSNELLNQLQENIRTSLRANFVDIPTDCPQRDERCGWTGDIAVFSPTAAFNMDISNFMKKWLGDLRLGQFENGSIPAIAPSNGFKWNPEANFWSGVSRQMDAVWGDSIVLVPWAVYQSSGKKEILEDCYDSMKRWIAFEKEQAEMTDEGPEPLIWQRGMQLGDWLAPGDTIYTSGLKARWTSTAYFANSAKLVSKIAEILGHAEDAAYYAALFEEIKAAFRKYLIDEDGHINGRFQSAWVLALQFDLLSEEERAIAIEDLVADIRAKNNHLGTGFVGTDKLNYALSDNGYLDVAYDVMLQETCPSWLYQVVCGATSTWERWDSLKPDGTINESDDGAENMVSFNHYAYGSVGNWMYQRIGGLEMTEPGYKEFKLAPMPGGGITWAEVSHKSPYGWIRSRWEEKDGKFTMNFTVPEGTIAHVQLPDGRCGKYEAGEYRI